MAGALYFLTAACLPAIMVPALIGSFSALFPGGWYFFLTGAMVFFFLLKWESELLRPGVLPPKGRFPGVGPGAFGEQKVTAMECVKGENPLVAEGTQTLLEAAEPAPELVSETAAEPAPPQSAETAGNGKTAKKAGPDNGDIKELEDIEELEEAVEDKPSSPSAREIATYKMNPFVPKEFLKLLHRESVMDLKLGDHHQQEMTIFFSDIRQFTELFESLSPEEGFRFINSYLTRIVPVIEQFGGFVDKYIGDAILALFPQSNGADMAVRSAIEIQKRVLEYNAHRAKCGYRPLEIGIGLHTGMLMLGVVGVYNRMQNTVISDSVNLASRIEGLTKAFGVSMAISGQTFQKLEHPESYMFRYLGNVKVKGRGEPTRVYEILNGISRGIMEKKMKTNMYFEQGLFSFMQKKYDEALANFNKVLEIIPNDKAALLYHEHCAEKVNLEEAVRVRA
ncbi:MAG: hypothetical protein LBJ90_07865 [Treponema sp.]|nr:hypothetical protein [Treponema sp.]